MCHTFKHLIPIKYLLLLTNLVIVFIHWVSTGVLYEPRQCSLFWDYVPESKLCFCVSLCRPSGHIQSDQYRSCSTVKQRRAVVHPDGEQPKTALWLWVREMTWHIFTRGVRGRTKAKQRWFKVTRELCHEWFHHVRHHVHDGHWAGEFATAIWRPHCFTASFRADVRGESGPREFASVNWRTNSAMGMWPIYKNYYTRVARKMAWYKILILVFIV